MLLSAPGVLVVVKHVAPLIAVHIVAPGRQFEKQGRKPGSLFVKAEARANCYVVMGMLRVPFVNRPFESEIHGTVNFTYFCCFLLVTWCHCVLLSCYLRPK